MLRTYTCTECGDFEDYRKDSEILTECPKCGEKITQVLGLNFKLNGDGWYSPDAGRMNNGG